MKRNTQSIQSQILQLSSKGLTNSAISRRMNIPLTVVLETTNPELGVVNIRHTAERAFVDGRRYH